MIIVNFDSIRIFNLPLDSKEKVLSKGDKQAKNKVKEFQKKYWPRSNEACGAWAPTSPGYGNVAYNHVPDVVKEEWLKNFEIVVRSSFLYKFLILVYPLRKIIDL